MDLLDTSLSLIHLTRVRACAVPEYVGDSWSRERPQTRRDAGKPQSILDRHMSGSKSAVPGEQGKP